MVEEEGVEGDKVVDEEEIECLKLYGFELSACCCVSHLRHSHVSQVLSCMFYLFMSRKYDR